MNEPTLEGPQLSEAAGVGALTIGGFVTEVAGRFAGNEALVFDDPQRDGETVRWDYAELLRQSTRVAAALIAAGVGKGTRVGILMGSRPEAVAAFFGAGLAGGVAVPLSTFSTLPELDYLLRHASVGVLLTQTTLLRRRFVDDLLELCPDLGEGRGPGAAFPYLSHAAAVGLAGSKGRVATWDEFLHAGDEVEPEVVRARADEVSPSDDGVIVYSSGTTDRPKGMLHNQRAPSLAILDPGPRVRPPPRDPAMDGVADVLDGRHQHGHGRDACRGRLLGDAGDVRTGRGPATHERASGSPSPTRSPIRRARWRSTRTGASADLSSLRSGVRQVGLHPASLSPGRHRMEHAGRRRAVRDVRLLRQPLFGLRRERCENAASAAFTRQRLRVVDPETGEALGPDAGRRAHWCRADADGALPGQLRGRVPRRRRLLPHRRCRPPRRGRLLHWTGRRTEMIKTAGANVSPAEMEVACVPASRKAGPGAGSARRAARADRRAVRGTDRGRRRHRR